MDHVRVALVEWFSVRCSAIAVIAQGLVPVYMIVVLLKDEQYRGIAGNTALQYR
jgi:hypothetical protein